jgi:hypothetical protein
MLKRWVGFDENVGRLGKIETEELWRWPGGSPPMLTTGPQNYMTVGGQNVLLEDMERIPY